MNLYILELCILANMISCTKCQNTGDGFAYFIGTTNGFVCIDVLSVMALRVKHSIKSSLSQPRFDKVERIIIVIDATII